MHGAKIRRVRRALAVTVALLAMTGTAHARPPVVLVIFDALPVQLLQDDQHRIDAVRFPNFAAFAAGGTWYRHATTISEATRFSVPAMLDGRQPRPGVRETYAGHPSNLFTLLAPHYRLNVWEEATQLCPRSLCKPRGPMDVIWRMRHGRAQRFRAGVAGVQGGGGRPQLTFIHTLFPHEPRKYLPDGRSYRQATGPDALGGPPSYDNRFLTEQVEQRTLLQLQFTDHLLGELVARMKQVGVFNRSMVALMSDHGESFDVKRGPAAPFQRGKLTYRRAVTEQNLEDIAGIAMFVKYPGQRRGLVDDRFVRHPDLLPTILRAADIPKPPGLIGHDLLDKGYRGHRIVQVEKQDGRFVSMPVQRWLARVAASKAHELSLFGSGEQSLFSFGPAPALLGVPVDDLTAKAPGSLQASVAGADAIARVSTHGSFLPAQVYGTLTGGQAAGHTLAFALNGTVVATAPSFAPLGKEHVAFSAMLPPGAFRDGPNRLEIFDVLGDRQVRRLYG